MHQAEERHTQGPEGKSIWRSKETGSLVQWGRVCRVAQDQRDQL